MDKHFDVIIIGSGAGGGTLAKQLAPSGKSILILERGDWLKREAANWDITAVFVENRYVSPDTWYDGSGKAFQPQVHYFVGGATKMFGAALYRLRERISPRSGITTASRPPGRSLTTNWSRITRGPRSFIRSMGCAAAIRPSLLPAALSVRSGLQRAAHSAVVR